MFAQHKFDMAMIIFETLFSVHYYVDIDLICSDTLNSLMQWLIKSCIYEMLKKSKKCENFFSCSDFIHPYIMVIFSFYLNFMGFICTRFFWKTLKKLSPIIYFILHLLIL